MRIGLLIVAGLVVSSCKKEPAPVLPPEPFPKPAAVAPKVKKMPAGELREEGFVSYAVFFTSAPKKAPEAVFNRLVAKTGFEVLKRPAARPGPAAAGFDASDDAEAPDAESLRYFGRGLSAEEMIAVSASKRSFALAFTYPATSIPAALKEADTLTAALVAETGGFIWDSETRETFSLEAFRTRRLAKWNGTEPKVAPQVIVHAYASGDAYRAVSLGMGKLGLPDLSVDDFPGDRVEQVNALLMVTMQVLETQPRLAKAGVIELDEGVTVTALVGTPQEGDAEGRLITLVPSAALLDQLDDRETVAMAAPDDGALLAASARARSELPEVKKRLARDLKAGVRVMVKVGFVEGDEKEYMWVRVQRWEGESITGTLESSPRYVTKLVAGADVTVKEADVFDWLRVLADGTIEGNATTKVLQGEK